MRRRSQAYLPGFESLSTRAFGGSLLGKGNPRDERPVSLKRPLHLVMRSSRATGPLSLLSPRRARRVEAIVRGTGKAHGVRIYRYANSGNHLHILLRAPSRRAYRAYVRAVSGLIARLVLGAERGLGQKSTAGAQGAGWKSASAPGAGRRNAAGTHGATLSPERKAAIQIHSRPADPREKYPFWDARPFTRIVEWGRDFGRACDYLLQNRLEALGFVPYRLRNKDRRPDTS